MSPASPPLTLVILAAGRSARFGRLKQLTPIGPGGAALLDYALYDGALAGFSRFVLVIRDEIRDDFDAHLRPAVAAPLPAASVAGAKRARNPARGITSMPSPNRMPPSVQL